MESCRSPLEMFRRAHDLGTRLWPTPHASRFSRKAFTRAQLFACLTLREYLGLSYRDAQAFLVDVPAWRDAIGLAGEGKTGASLISFEISDVPVSATASSSAPRQPEKLVIVDLGWLLLPTVLA